MLRNIRFVSSTRIILPTNTFLSLNRFCHSGNTPNNDSKKIKIEFNIHPVLTTIKKIIGYSSDIKLKDKFFSSPETPNELIPIVVPRTIGVLLMGLTYVVYKGWPEK